MTSLLRILDQTVSYDVPFSIDERKRFLVLVAGVCGCFCVSFIYFFTIIGNYVKTEYNYSQGQMTTITTIGNAISWAMFPIGYLFDFLGPKACLTLGTTLISLGLLCFALTFEGVITSSVAKITVFDALMSVGCGCFDCGTIMTLMLNFPAQRGAAVIIAKVFAGLGTSWVALFYSGWFLESYTNLMYFAFGLTLTLGTLAAIFASLPPYYLTGFQRRRLSPERIRLLESTKYAYDCQKAPIRRLYLGYILVAISFIYLTAQSIVTGYVELTSGQRSGLAIGSALLLLSFGSLAAPIKWLDYLPPEDAFVPLTAEAAILATSHETADGQVQATKPVEPTQQPKEDGEEVSANDHAEVDEARKEGDACTKEPVGKRQRTFEEAAELTAPPMFERRFLPSLLTPEIWCVWWNGVCVWGAGLIMKLNGPQIYRTINQGSYDPTYYTLLAAMSGLGSALGIVCVGGVQLWLRTRSTPFRFMVTFPYMFAPVLTITAYILYLTVPPEGLFVPFFLEPFGNGFSWSCTVMLVPTLYGLDVGKTYLFLYTGGLVAVLALNRFCFGVLYDREAHRQGTYPICSGRDCVSTTFYICIGLNFSAFFASLFLHLRYRRYVVKKMAEQREKAARLFGLQPSDADGSEAGSPQTDGIEKDLKVPAYLDQPPQSSASEEKGKELV